MIDCIYEYLQSSLVVTTKSAVMNVCPARVFILQHLITKELYASQRSLQSWKFQGSLVFLGPGSGPWSHLSTMTRMCNCFSFQIKSLFESQNNTSDLSYLKLVSVENRFKFSRTLRFRNVHVNIILSKDVFAMFPRPYQTKEFVS